MNRADRVRANSSKVGPCQDRKCEYGPDVLGSEDDPMPTIYQFQGVWRCDGCIEDIRDNDQWYAANAPDFDWM